MKFRANLPFGFVSGTGWTTLFNACNLCHDKEVRELKTKIYTQGN